MGKKQVKQRTERFFFFPRYIAWGLELTRRLVLMGHPPLMGCGSSFNCSLTKATFFWVAYKRQVYFGDRVYLISTHLQCFAASKMLVEV